MLQISLKQKLSENPSYLYDYAVNVSKNNHINKLQNELTVSEAIYESLVFSKK